MFPRVTIYCSFVCVQNASLPYETVLESPGKPVTGSPSILKGCHNSLISTKNAKDIDGVPVTGIPGISRTVKPISNFMTYIVQKGSYKLCQDTQSD